MLKYCSIIVVFVFTFSSNSQNTLIKIQNFDEPNLEWNFTTDISFFDNNSDGFFGIHDGDQDNDINDTGFASKTSSIGSIKIENDFLFIHDLSDEGDNGTNENATLTFNNIDISNYHNVIVSFDFEIFEFDSLDNITYEIVEDNVSTQMMQLPKNEIGSIEIPIKNNTNLVSIKLIIKQNGIDDFAAIDNIILKGNLIVPCNELMISEYIEGTSSTNFRNNYLEIYNPNNHTIDLENYDLVKYTGPSLIVSNTLNLTGTIPAYGTFLIEDINENLGVIANISTNNAVMDFTGDDKIGLRKSNQIIDLIGVIGDASNFAKDLTLRRKSNIQNPNNEFYTDEWDIYGLEDLSNINSHETSCSGSIPEIEIRSNDNEIIDGNANTSILNNTYFGTADLNSGNNIIKRFYIKNLGIANLNVSLNIYGIHADNFSILKTPASIIMPNDSTEVQISFLPSSLGIKTALVNIENNDASENPFNFYIQGEGSGTSGSPVMITQYYEGTSNNKWIEITNISSNEIPLNSYYLALYWNDDAKNPIGINPSRNILIPNLLPGQTLKYRSTLEVLEPSYALDGNEIKSSICSFTGDDMIIISTTNDATCWENRLDMIGNSSNWGADTCFVRKYGCEAVTANTGFDINDWLAYNISEINTIGPSTNQRIGNHYVGNTVYTNLNNWNNGLPDQYRNAVIDYNFESSIAGNLEFCNLTINAGKGVDIESNNFLSVSNDLVVNGILNIQHEGSIIMINDNGNIISNGEIRIHKTTMALKKYDYTYWSSPIKNAILENVFYASPQNSFYHFLTQNYSDLNNDNLDDDNNSWDRTNGNMNIGIGYTAMAPNSISSGETQSVIFNGEINNGIYNVPIYLSEDNLSEFDDWNLIGNPYPSAIDANIFLNNPINTDLLNGSIYFWTHNTEATTSGNEKRYSSDDYSVYNIGTGGVAANSNGVIPTGKIASGQAFFVEAIQEGNIQFKNDVRVKLGNNIFFKSNEKKFEQDKIWLNLFNDQGVFNQILIGFLEDATPLFESNYDALRLEGGNVSFYSIIENKNLAIQGSDPLVGNERMIPLGFSSNIDEALNLEIGIDHLQGNLRNRPIYLYDQLLNTIHDLSSGNYEFAISNKGIFNDRFSLRFNGSNLDIEENQIINEKLIIIKKSQSIIIRTNKNNIISSLIIYDLLGRKVLDNQTGQKEVNIDKNSLNVTGVYIIHAKLKNSNVIIKKIII